MIKWCLALTAVCFGVSTSTGAAQDFRVETEVFDDKQTEPSSESLTVFSGDVVYDFSLAPQVETTVFDVRRGKLVLLDESRQIRASVTTDELTEFTAAIKSRGVEQGDRDLFDPKFQTTFDESQQRVTLTSDRLTYSAKGAPSKQANAALRYRQFADWYARLNAMRPDNLPPFGRLELNQALAERELIPIEVERTVTTGRAITAKSVQARSKHTVTWLISGTDQKRIDQAGHNLAKLREVSLNEYWADSLKTARKK